MSVYDELDDSDPVLIGDVPPPASDTAGQAGWYPTLAELREFGGRGNSGWRTGYGPAR